MAEGTDETGPTNEWSGGHYGGQKGGRPPSGGASGFSKDDRSQNQPDFSAFESNDGKASRIRAEIARDQFDRYMDRFAPIEEEQVDFLMSGAGLDDALRDARGSVSQAFTGTSIEQEERTVPGSEYATSLAGGLMRGVGFGRAADALDDAFTYHEDVTRQTDESRDRSLIGQQERGLSRFGATQTAGQRASQRRQNLLREATARDDATNRVRRDVEDRRMQLMTGGLGAARSEGDN